MQHHGAPTRLLDFSNSPFIALYFSIEEYFDEDSAVWAVDSKFFQKKAVDLLSKKYKDFVKNDIISFQDLLPELINENDLECIFPLEPFSKNKRFQVQQGVFLCQGTITDTVEENLKFVDNPSTHVKKVIIKKDWRGKILYDLNLMNITRESLFQNMEGFSKRLALYFDTLFYYNITNDLKFNSTDRRINDHQENDTNN